MEWWPLVVSAACAGILMPVVIRARSIGHDEPGGVQKLHLVRTSRLGGVIVVVACLAVPGVAALIGQAGLSAALSPGTQPFLAMVMYGANRLVGRMKPTWPRVPPSPSLASRTSVWTSVGEPR